MSGVAADADCYSVYFETRAPVGTAATDLENAADLLMDLLMDNSGTVSASRGSWGARVSVLAFDVREAAETGAHAAEHVAAGYGDHRLGLPNRSGALQPGD